MPSPKTPREPYQCSGSDAAGNRCQNMVQPRRISETGHHFCPEDECQRQKQRTYYRKRNAIVKADLEEEFIHFVLAMSRPRMTCPTCGRRDAINGYAHGDRANNRCDGTGGKGFAFLTSPGVFGRMLEAIHHLDTDPFGDSEVEQ